MSAALTATSSRPIGGSGDAKKSRPRVQVTRRKGQPQKTRPSDTLTDATGNTVADPAASAKTAQSSRVGKPVTRQKKQSQSADPSGQGPIVIDTEGSAKTKGGNKPGPTEKKSGSRSARRTASNPRKQARRGFPDWIWYVIIALAAVVLIILLVMKLTGSGPLN